MVEFLCTQFSVLVAQTNGSPWSKLAPEQRARLGGALFLLIMAGATLVFLAWAALRVGRRNSRREDVTWDRLRGRTNADDWVAKPLVKRDDAGQDSGPE